MNDGAVAPPAVPEALTRYIGFLLSRMGTITQKRFSSRLEAVEVTPRMWGALNVLEAAGPITQHGLCKRTGMDPSSRVATIDDLERKGLVERRAHPSDRRAYALHVTDAGRETLARGREVVQEVEDELLAPLDDAEREQLRSLLLRLVTAAGNTP
ncbi:MAG: MarR family winged helix-turn-helix transcriptional regulator [Solirubrobacteraceae bacterium]